MNITEIQHRQDNSVVRFATIFVVVSAGIAYLSNGKA
jgi:hypothetical protein